MIHILIGARENFVFDQSAHLLMFEGKEKSKCTKPFLCEGALRHRNTRELYSNNLRAVGPKHAQLKTNQNRKQNNKTRHKDQNKVNK